MFFLAFLRDMYVVGYLIIQKKVVRLSYRLYNISIGMFFGKGDDCLKITYIHIRNFIAINDLEINDIENALILVGKNNTGKTIVIDAIRAVVGDYKVQKRDFLDGSGNISIGIRLEFSDSDLKLFNNKGIVSKYKKYDKWLSDFKQKLPSFNDGILSFECIINKQGFIKYDDGFVRNNKKIKDVLPKIYHIDHSRSITAITNDLIQLYDTQDIYNIKENICMFDKSKKCTKCFNCIGFLENKTAKELNAFEAARVLEYKLLSINVKKFEDRVNKYFLVNGSRTQTVNFSINFNIDGLFSIDTMIYNKDRDTLGSVNTLGEGIKSIFVMSLLEAYIEEESVIPSIILMEDPEIYLHPQLQKSISEMLFRLSKKNQVVFTTHSPNLIFNFSSKQIKQVMLDKDFNTVINENTNIDEILDDLGYNATDLMNVNFVFIVEGKQDRNRLPLLLEKHYSEIVDEDGNLLRVSIIPTNSCTNIQTYANLRYINKLYLKDQFLMIRDSDGKNPKYLVKQLCNYYSVKKREEEFSDLPKVEPKNVLVLKYYSFENYFLEPEIMAKIGVIKNEDEFYTTLYSKYKDYLYRLSSTKRMIKATGIRIRSKKDIKENFESFKIYVRGHNLFDIFYGRYKKDAQTEILRKYIEIAPRDTFKDIFDAIDSFVYFENRKRTDDE